MDHTLINNIESKIRRISQNELSYSFVLEGEPDMFNCNLNSNSQLKNEDSKIKSEELKNLTAFKLDSELRLLIIENRLSFELQIEGKKYVREILDGSPIFIDTIQEHLDLYMAAELFDFSTVDKKLQSFDVYFDILYPCPPYKTTSGRVIHPKRKIEIERVSVQIP